MQGQDTLQEHLSRTVREERKWCVRFGWCVLLLCLLVPFAILFQEERQRALGNYHSALATMKHCQNGLDSVLSFSVPDDPMNLCAHAAKISVGSPFLAAVYKTLDRMGLGFLTRVMVHSVENAVYSAIVYSAVGYALVLACRHYKGGNSTPSAPPPSFYHQHPAHMPNYMLHIPSSSHSTAPSHRATLTLLPENHLEESKHAHND